jgi:hypothetical protein
MLYKFKSKCTGDVIMLQVNGQQVLKIIGKHSEQEPSTKGILLPEQMTSALAALDMAIRQEDELLREALAQAKADQRPPPHTDEITLHQRAVPFMEMIRQCMKAREAITWGV